MKKFWAIFLCAILTLMLCACTDPQPENEPQKLAAPVVTLAGDTASWQAVEGASGYVVSKNGTELAAQSETSYKIADTEVGEYVIKVKAVAADSAKNSNSDYSNEVTYVVQGRPVVSEGDLKNAKLYVVGDSTLSSFSDAYLYPRYGYGTQLSNYFSSKLTVVNLALSGRSSKNFVLEANYETLKSGLSEGDYLLVGFGHNDEKNDDATRFTDATKPVTASTSFKYSLYENYVKLAESKGATAILCTPVVRADTKNDYSAASGHVTSTGDYAKAIVELGQEKNVAVVNLRDLTKAKYSSLGYDEARNYHAVVSGQYASDGKTIVPDWNTVDKTHLNIYGAKYVAYLVAKTLQSSSCSLGDYVLGDIAEPTKANDLVANSKYAPSDYQSPNLTDYKAPNHFKVNTEGWYGTAFGDTGGSPSSEGNGFVAKEVSTGIYSVGQYKSGSNKGKFTANSDGFAFLFRQVDKDTNFTLTAQISVVRCEQTAQAGFGLMLRDDCYINLTATQNVTTNYVTAGLLMGESNTTFLFKRENKTFSKGSESVSGFYAADDTATVSISRKGQLVDVSVTYKGKTYTESYLDFDFFATDSQYMYVGVFANRGTIVEVTDLQFQVTGTSLGA